jgi:hypothetical protein
MSARLGRFLALAGAVGLVCSLAVWRSSTARAGDRRLEVILVNMTAEPDDAARRCFRHIQRSIADDYTNIRRMGETPMRRRVGHPTGDFMEWQASEFDVLQSEGTYHDTVVLVDCRPTERVADILVTSPADGAARMRLRRVDIDRGRARWLAETILRHVWVGFSP